MNYILCRKGFGNMRLLLSFMVLILGIFFNFQYLTAVTIEEALDKEILGDKAYEKAADENALLNTNALWKIFGFIESVNQVYVPKKKAGAADNYKIIKLEGHGRLNAIYGTDIYFGKAVLDGYFYPEVTGDSESAEWTLPRKSGTIEAQELYFKGGKDFQFKIGKQLFSWGAADMFRITNYLDRQDQREFFTVDEDYRYRGVPALSLKMLLGNFSVEAAGTPLHNPALMPEEGSFWYYTPGSTGMPGGEIPLVITEGEKKKASLKNGAGAVRAGGTFGYIDFHLSYYNGMNTNLLYMPDLAFISLTDISIELQPVYDRVEVYGLDIAAAIDKLSFRAEALYSPDMVAVKEINPDALMTGITEIMMNGTTEEQISTAGIAPYFAYVTGADYNLWGNNGLVLVEWMQGLYLKDRKDYIEPIINKMLLVRIEDKFLNESLEAEIGSVAHISSTDYEKLGYAVTGKLTWNFKNGLTVSAGTIVITGKEDGLLSAYDDKDMCYLKAKMAF